ncbi:hypothetical protein NKH18_01205 [Streptomyces sp. M10(2022)]
MASRAELKASQATLKASQATLKASRATLENLTAMQENLTATVEEITATLDRYRAEEENHRDLSYLQAAEEARTAQKASRAQGALLNLAALLLPGSEQADWLEAERGYLADKPTRRERWGWVGAEIFAMPKYVYTVRTGRKGVSMTALPPGPPNEPLLSQRAVLVLLTAFFMGFVIGGLTYLSTHDVAAAALAGVAGAGPALSACTR